MTRLYQTYKTVFSTNTFRLIFYLMLTLFESLLIVWLLSGKLDRYVTIDQSTRAILGGFFGLSITLTVFTLFSFPNKKEKISYSDLLNDTEAKYLIFRTEIEKQKTEIANKINEDNEELNNLLQQRLYSLERELLDLQDQKYWELKNIFEKK